MVLRADVVRERLKKLEESVTRLREIGAVSRDDFKADYRHAWLAERGLELAAQALLDIGAHILSGQFGESPSTYEEIIQRLGQRVVIPARLAEELHGLGGFRNILVHGYLRIDLDRVYDALKKSPDDFTEFEAAVLEWLDRLGS
ncbi:MAG: type VII toxin-antitoxin system HepT family RNase toxin [Candidatus Binatia bacterium]